MKRNKRKVQLWCIDTGIFMISYVMIAFLMGVGQGWEVIQKNFTLERFFVLYACVCVMRLLLNVYGSIWRYVDVAGYLKMMIADMVGGILFCGIGLYSELFHLEFPYTVGVVLMAGEVSVAIRLLYQYLYAYQQRIQDQKGEQKEKSSLHKINIAIVGAGNIGASLAAELIRNPMSHYKPYCFIDKDIQKVGHEIYGLKIYDEGDNIVERLREMPVQEIVIALPDSTAEERAELYAKYKKTKCKVKIYDYPLGDKKENGSRMTLREIHIEDLLFRDTLKVKGSQAKEFYRDKKILVTGGGGSIGSELCRQIAMQHPKRLVILDIYENNAYEIQQELIRVYGNSLNLETVIASVRDVKRLEEIFAKEKPDIVFHAAAHKHVPLMEHSGCEAIKNNVLGTYNVANMAEKYGVKKFLLISTDKAVNPTNIMGASKRLCEMVIQCRTDSDTEFTAVRFGNVLGSNGSVIPLFKKQIASGGPITLTDKRIIRYFMTIPEAVGLVMEACTMAHNGELYVLDMGKPVKILDLAENMISLSGLTPYKDIDIVEIGLRPGEKLYEELLMKTEELDKTSNDLIFVERDKGLSRAEVEEKLAILKEALEREGKDNIIAAVKATVPTYNDPERVNRQAEQSQEMCCAFGGSKAVLNEGSI